MDDYTFNKINKSNKSNHTSKSYGHVMTKFEYDVNEIIPNLWLGNYKSAYNKYFLNTYKIKNIITIMDTFDEKYKYDNITYLTIPIKDKFVCNKNMNSIFDLTSVFIEKCLQKNEPVLVHCAKGHHRSAALVVAYLIRFKKGDYVKCIEYINKLRPYALRRDTCMSKHLFRYYLLLNNKTCEMVCSPHGTAHYCLCKN
jgi:protein-tyrosine phosphatase